jgi:HEPN domain-containing protein
MSAMDEWVEKAEADYKAAITLNRRRRDPLPDIVCFHCQQCAEKYLKAYLVVHGTAPPLIHDLQALLNLASAHDASLMVLDPLAGLLNRYAVAIRYPSLTATPADANNAVVALRRIRTVLRRKLGL